MSCHGRRPRDSTVLACLLKRKKKAVETRHSRGALLDPVAQILLGAGLATMGNLPVDHKRKEAKKEKRPRPIFFRNSVLACFSLKKNQLQV